MAQTFVFLDVETTGLNPDRDRIIEVAVVAWRDGEIVDQLTSLINPKIAIPSFVSQLTGITDEMVKNAPSLPMIRPKIKRIIGDGIIVGHNVQFDVSFLQAAQIVHHNHRMDTLALASILLPEAGSYDLEHLVRTLDLPKTTTHRAEADTLHTLNLYLALQRIAVGRERALLDEIVQFGNMLGWPETLFFENALHECTSNDALTHPRYLFDVPNPRGDTLVAIEDEEKLTPIDVEMVVGMLKEGSNFSRVFPAYELRQQQVEMVSAVAGALNNHQHLLVEAGTGTGKSLAYLLPAAFWAYNNERRVVISTNTINLQDQLIHKDIPALSAALPFEIRAAVRKGRSNYLCMNLFQQMRQHGPKSRDEMIVFARLLLWLRRTETGDVAELPLRNTAERMVWRRLSGEASICNPQDCSSERCPLHYVRRRAEYAHIVIVNHALLLADADAQNHILPDYKELIIDEGHHFEAAVTSGMSFSADQHFLKVVLESLTNVNAGIITALQNSITGLSRGKQDIMMTEIKQLRQAGAHAIGRFDDLFGSLSYFLSDKINSRTEFTQQIRLIEEMRDSVEFHLVRRDWKNAHVHLSEIIKSMKTITTGLAQLLDKKKKVSDGDDVLAELTSQYRSIVKITAHLNLIIEKVNPEFITWIEIWKGRVSLHAAPLHVGELVEKYLWNKLDSVVMTSATMRTAPSGRQIGANFDYLRERLNAQDSNRIQELSVGSPFNYKKNTLLYICTDIPEPNQPGYQRYVEQAIIDVAKTLGGRTMVLFTSYKQLKETTRAVSVPLAQAGIAILAQKTGASRQQLIDQFKSPDARAVLLGTRSFWEGVDVPGKALEAVILVKLPFDVPTDPIVGARSETFANPFMEYAIPEAILRFRQGFGRLNRRKSDEGIVLVLDKRVLTKRYGELFLTALPDCVLLRQRTTRLPEIIERWQKRAR